MKISISEARSKLPKLVKKLREDSSITYEITVHSNVVAELKAPPKIEPGLAAKKLLGVMKKLPEAKTPGKIKVSEEINRYLYGKKK